MLVRESDQSWNVLEVQQHRGKSRLVTSRTFVPLKVFNPQVHASTCTLFLSHFGGGMLDGDDVRLKVRCGRGSTVAVGSFGSLQAYTATKNGATQTVEGDVQDGALAVILPDPVVLHAGSRFRQRQEWRLARGGSLLVAECMIAGRVRTGESFAFDTYEHEFSVLVDGMSLLFDRLVCRPSDEDFSDPALLGGAAYLVTVYMVGPRWEPVKLSIEDEGLTRGNGDRPNSFAAMHPVQDNGYVFRAVANDGESARAVVKTICRMLAREDYLGFDPGSRKY